MAELLKIMTVRGRGGRDRIADDAVMRAYTFRRRHCPSSSVLAIEPSIPVLSHQGSRPVPVPVPDSGGIAMPPHIACLRQLCRNLCLEQACGNHRSRGTPSRSASTDPAQTGALSDHGRYAPSIFESRAGEQLCAQLFREFRQLGNPSPGERAKTAFDTRTRVEMLAEAPAVGGVAGDPHGP